MHGLMESGFVKNAVRKTPFRKMNVWNAMKKIKFSQIIFLSRFYDYH